MFLDFYAMKPAVAEENKEAEKVTQHEVVPPQQLKEAVQAQESERLPQDTKNVESQDGKQDAKKDEVKKLMLEIYDICLKEEAE